MDAGAFSDQRVVAAAGELGRVLIDADRDEKLFQKYKVGSMPTIIFLNYKGEPAEQLKGRAPDDVAKQIAEVLDRHSRGPKWISDAASAVAAGRRDSKPVVLVYRDDGPKSEAFLKLFRDASFKPELLEKCVFAKVAFAAESEDAKKREVKEAPTLVILDPTGEGDPKVIKKTTVAKTAEIRKELEAAVKQLAKEKKDKKE